ncbi:MAG: hypothetical protein U0166_22390 [Acidobacteriota bacterium]
MISRALALLAIALLPPCLRAQDAAVWIAAVVQDATDGAAGRVVLEPIAQCDTRGCKTSWPEPVEEASEKIARLEQIPARWLAPSGKLPREWTLVMPGSAPRTFGLKAPTVVQAGCVEKWGIVTDLPPIKPAGEMFEAMAFSQKVDAIPAVPVVATSPEGEAVLASIARSFDGHERAALLAAAAGKEPLTLQGIPADAEARAKEALVLEMASRVDLPGGEALVAFRAARTYHRGSEETRGPDTTLLQGWMRRAKDGSLRIVDHHVDLTDGDRVDVAEVEPLLSFELYGKRLVVAETTFYEAAAYAILEVGPEAPKSLIDVSSGGC